VPLLTNLAADMARYRAARPRLARRPSRDARIFTRQDAADYCRLSLSGFDGWVRKGLLPGPINGTRRWDRKALDRALDGEGRASAQALPLDAWMATRAR